VNSLVSRIALVLTAPLLGITVTGFASALGQIIMMRELLVLFYGNELSAGLVFTCWLLWTAAGSGLAGRWSPCLRGEAPVLAITLLLLALLLPATLVWIRATRPLWGIPLGEVLSPGKMLLIAATTTGPFCLVSGFLFAFTWRLQTVEISGKQAQPLHIYLGEAAGSALGGLFLYFVALPRWTVVTAVLLGAWLLLLAAAGILWGSRKRSTEAVKPHVLTFWLLCGAVLVAAVIAAARWDAVTHRWQWGPQLVTVRDSPYHNLALIRQEDQVSLFANGLWLFSAPDPQTAEQSVHLAMLQHPQPRSVLLVGGGIAGLLSEILKYPHLDRVDYVEPDPEIIRLAEQFFPPAASAALHHPAVGLVQEDAGSFIRRAPQRYDVILLDVGEPMNIQLNRFYTVEFYHRISQLLAPGGIFSFAAGTSADIVGPVQARFLRSVAATLRSVFPHIMIYPGDTARFLATDATGHLLSDPRELTQRLTELHLQLHYIRPDTLLDALSPLRLQTLERIIAPAPHQTLNQDFRPICAFNNLLIWGAQLHPGISRMLLAAAGLDRLWWWGLLAAAMMAVLVVSPKAPVKPHAAVGFCVMVVGGALMSGEIVLLLAFQVFAGFVYAQLALIIAFFMVGLALGAALCSGFEAWLDPAKRWLLVVQLLLCGYLAALVQLLYILQKQMQAAASGSPPLPVIFALLALTAGLLGGLHFSLAVRTLAGTQVASAKTGGGLYGLDLVGAAAGALLTSLVLLPIAGLIITLGVFMALGFGSALMLSHMRSFTPSR
jgi:spermidine synthase